MIKRKLVDKEVALKYCGKDGYILGLPGRYSLRLGEQYKYSPMGLPNKLMLEPVIDQHILNPETGLGVFRTSSFSNSSDYPYLLLPLNAIEEVELREFHEVAEAVFRREIPGRYWIDHYAKIAYIHYPEITITNTIGTVHTIHDLIIRLSSAGEKLNSMTGTRVSYTNTELEKVFLHSHLQRTSLEAWNNFCLGESTPVSKYVAKLKNSIVTEDDISLLLTQLDSYLSWESMEGKPYISINTLTFSEQLSIDSQAPRITTEQQLVYAKMFLQKLTSDMLINFGGEWMLIPKYCSDKLLAIEQQIIAEANIPNSALYNYDLAADYYLTTSTSRARQLPNFNSEIRNVVTNIGGITPRIIQERQRDDSSVIKRFGHADMTEILQNINDLLLNGTHNNG